MKAKLLLVIVLTSICFAKAVMAANDPPAQTGKTISQALDFWISNTERDVVSAADAMPEEKYSFTPSGGEFTGVRTFADQVKHLAANNYRMAGRMLGHSVAPDQEAET